MRKAASKTRMQQIHDAYNKHEMMPLASIFNKERQFRLVIFSCPCGSGPIRLTYGIRVGCGDDAQDTHCMDCLYFNDNWRDTAFSAIAKMPNLAKRISRLPLPHRKGLRMDVFMSAYMAGLELGNHRPGWVAFKERMVEYAKNKK